MATIAECFVSGAKTVGERVLSSGTAQAMDSFQLGIATISRQDIAFLQFVRGAATSMMQMVRIQVAMVYPFKKTAA